MKVEEAQATTALQEMAEKTPKLQKKMNQHHHSAHSKALNLKNPPSQSPIGCRVAYKC